MRLDYRRILTAFGNLLNFSPGGLTHSRRTLDALYEKAILAQDSRNIADDFRLIGHDLNRALLNYERSEKAYRKISPGCRISSKAVRERISRRRKKRKN